MPDFEHQNDENLTLQLAEYPVIAAPVTPDVVQFAFELLAPLAGIVSPDNAFIKVGESGPQPVYPAF